jgi:hypothetical protein
MIRYFKATDGVFTVFCHNHTRAYASARLRIVGDSVAEIALSSKSTHTNAPGSKSELATQLRVTEHGGVIPMTTQLPPECLETFLVLTGVAMAGMRAGYWLFDVGVKSCYARLLLRPLLCGMSYTRTSVPICATDPSAATDPCFLAGKAGLYFMFALEGVYIELRTIRLRKDGTDIPKY